MTTIQLQIDFFKTPLPDITNPDIGLRDIYLMLHDALKEANRHNLFADIRTGQILTLGQAIKDKSQEIDQCHYDNFLKNNEITPREEKELKLLWANYYRWVQDGNDPDLKALEKMSRKGFMEFTKSPPEVQAVVLNSSSNTIDRDEVRQLAKGFQAATSQVVPEIVREKFNHQELSSSTVVQLANSLEKLPEDSRTEFQEIITNSATVTAIVETTEACKQAAKAFAAAEKITTFEIAELSALIELAQPWDLSAELASTLTALQEVESLTARLHQRLAQLRNKAGEIQKNSEGRLYEFAKTILVFTNGEMLFPISDDLQIKLTLTNQADEPAINRGI